MGFEYLGRVLAIWAFLIALAAFAAGALIF